MEKKTVSRRAFVAAAGVFAAAPIISGCVTAPGVARTPGAPRVFKFALVGCGGRGSGAAKNIMDAAARLGQKAVLVAAADFFQDKAAAVCKACGCDEKFAFGGPLGYRQVMASDAEIVLLAAPPLFRPLHAEACVKAGKHIFAEKPVATDPAGLRRFLQVVDAAKAAKLSILSGTCHRHNSRALRMIGPVRKGVIGEIRGGVVYRCHGAMSTANYLRRRRPQDTNASYLANNWYHFREMSADHLTEQAVHEIDLANWFIGRLPERAMGIGARHRRSTGNTYDCFGIDYDYGNGLHVHAVARQINGCFDRCCAMLSGTEGQIDVLGSKILRPDGTSEPFPFDEKAVAGRDGNMYTMEHADFLSGLLSGDYLQEGEQVAMATASGMLGTLAAYTGQMVRMSDLLTNQESPFYNMNHPICAEDFEKGDALPVEEGKPMVPGQPEK